VKVRSVTWDIKTGRKKDARREQGPLMKRKKTRKVGYDSSDRVLA
jgi:hypothetical protein